MCVWSNRGSSASSVDVKTLKFKLVNSALKCVFNNFTSMFREISYQQAGNGDGGSIYTIYIYIYTHRHIHTHTHTFLVVAFPMPDVQVFVKIRNE